MSILPILIHHHPVLRKKAEVISEMPSFPNSELPQLIADMFETMYDAPGIGLAAPQVGVSKRLFVIDVGEREDGSHLGKHVFINPEIIEATGKTTYEEGCLSLPGVNGVVERFAEVTVKFINAAGQEDTLLAKGLFAICIQHELDHLNGILFPDRIKGIRGQIVKKAMERLAKDNLRGRLKAD